MWKLHKSRGQFLAKHKAPNDRSFWWQLTTDQANAQPNEEDRKTFLAWRDDSTNTSAVQWEPTNSNCPAMSATVDSVVSLLPPEWKGIGRNVFVGIVVDGEVNASAWNHTDAGIIEINLQYLWILEEYASAFDEYRHAISRRISSAIGDRDVLPAHKDADYGKLIASWKKLENAAESWRNPAMISPGGELLTQLAPGRKLDERNRVITAAESFIIAHELAHHVMAHTSQGAKRRAREAQHILKQVFDFGEATGCTPLTTSWKQEIEADIVAIAILSEQFEGHGRREAAYLALFGSVIALTSVAHIERHWSNDDIDESHPSLTTRLQYIHAAIDMWYGDLERGIHGDHPLDLWDQLELFVQVAMLSMKYPDLVNSSDEQDLLNIVAIHQLKRWNALVEEIPLPMNLTPLIPPERRTE